MGRTVAQDWFAPLVRFAQLAGGASTRIVYGGDSDQPRTTTPVFGWRSIEQAVMTESNPSPDHCS